jgi:hypothetical protein
VRFVEGRRSADHELNLYNALIGSSYTDAGIFNTGVNKVGHDLIQEVLNVASGAA